MKTTLPCIAAVALTAAVSLSAQTLPPASELANETQVKLPPLVVTGQTTEHPLEFALDAAVAQSLAPQQKISVTLVQTDAGFHLEESRSPLSLAGSTRGQPRRGPRRRSGHLGATGIMAKSINSRPDAVFSLNVAKAAGSNERFRCVWAHGCDDDAVAAAFKAEAGLRTPRRTLFVSSLGVEPRFNSWRLSHVGWKNGDHPARPYPAWDCARPPYGNNARDDHSSLRGPPTR